MTAISATPSVLRRRASDLFIRLADRRDLAYHRGDGPEADRLTPFIALAGHLALLGAAVDGPATARAIEAAIADLKAVTAPGRSPSREEAHRFERSLQALGRRVGDMMRGAPLH